MSYILDALRRADAERQRGGVPGLHDPAGPVAAGPAAAAPPGATARSPWPWLAGGALVLVAVAGAWWLGRGMADAPMAATTPTVVPLVPVSVQVQPALAPATPVPTMPAPAPAPPPAQPLQRALAPTPTPVAQPPRGGAPLTAPAPVAASPAPTSGPPPAQVEPTTDAVRAWASLPEASRSAMPALAWSGAVHAERAEQRLVIVNGQVAREGDTIASGVQLLQIRPKSVLLRWQGQRIEMPL